MAIQSLDSHKYLRFSNEPNPLNYLPITRTTELQHDHYPSQSKIVNYTSLSRLSQSTLTPPNQPVHTPSLLERVKSIKFSSSSYNENAFPSESVHISNSPSQLTRAPSFPNRVKSFRILSSLTHTPDHNVIKSKSAKCIGNKEEVIGGDEEVT